MADVVRNNTLMVVLVRGGDMGVVMGRLTVTTAAKAISPMRRGMEIMRARAGMMGGGFFVLGGSC